MSPGRFVAPGMARKKKMMKEHGGRSPQWKKRKSDVATKKIKIKKKEEQKFKEKKKTHRRR
jgi:hypothetical protein